MRREITLLDAMADRVNVGKGGSRRIGQDINTGSGPVTHYVNTQTPQPIGLLGASIALLHFQFVET